MPCYAVRSLYLWGQKSNGNNVIEERIVAFQASDDEEAFSKAEAEASDYSLQEDGDDYEIHTQQMSYLLDDSTLSDGYEVWSQLFETDESLDAFYQNRYVRYTCHPPE